MPGASFPLSAGLSHFLQQRRLVPQLEFPITNVNPFSSTCTSIQRPYWSVPTVTWPTSTDDDPSAYGWRLAGKRTNEGAGLSGLAVCRLVGVFSIDRDDAIFCFVHHIVGKRDESDDRYQTFRPVVHLPRRIEPYEHYHILVTKRLAFKNDITFFKKSIGL